jgi:TfoX/Sxy family transcriptional regulator of competence genes
VAKSPPDSDYAARLAFYEAVVTTVPGVERKGDTMPYTSMNGNMFSLLTKEGTLVLRMGEADRATFVKKFQTEPVVQYGTVMKEYVAVPDSLLAKTKELAKYFKMSVEYAKGLKAKPTTRKKKDASAKRR